MQLCCGFRFPQRREALSNPFSKAESPGRPLSVAFLAVMPSPYMEDLFAAMEKDGRIQPHVYYMEMTAPDTYWGNVALPGYATILPGGWHNVLGGRVHVNPTVIGNLRGARADVYVIMGYSALTSQLAMHWLRMTGRPWIFWGEIPGMRSSRRLFGWLRWLAQRPAVRWPDAIAGIGSNAVSVYNRLAIPSCPVMNIPYHCDLSKFTDLPRPPTTQVGKPLKFLYCGQLIERKGVDILLEAFSRVALEYADVHLTLVGEGPLRSRLASELPSDLRSQVHFAGFHPPRELPTLFGKADVFVLPSRHDGWGVVVNQALAAGLPVICTSAVGAAADLVRHGENGFVVDPGDVTTLHQALAKFASDRELVSTFGQKSRELAGNWSLECGVERWNAICNDVLQRRECRV